MKNTHSKIFKREDGTRIKVIVELFGYRQKLEYRTCVKSCKKHKRTWIGTYDTDDYSYRLLSLDERRVFEYNSQFSLISKEELLSVMNELWESIKPALKV